MISRAECLCQVICFVGEANLSWQSVFRQRHISAGAGELPFYFRRGAVRRGSNIKYQNSLWKNAVNNDMRIKDYGVNNLLENR